MLPVWTCLSILFYPITLKGCRGTTDEFATIPFHLVLFSAGLVELAKSIPVHSLILSSHLFFCLPLFLFPFTVPCRTVFAKPEDLEIWPNHLSFRFLTRVRSLSYSPMAALDLSANLHICKLSKLGSLDHDINSTPKANGVAKLEAGRMMFAHWSSHMRHCLQFYININRAVPVNVYEDQCREDQTDEKLHQWHPERG